MARACASAVARSAGNPAAPRGTGSSSACANPNRTCGTRHVGSTRRLAPVGERLSKTPCRIALQCLPEQRGQIGGWTQSCPLTQNCTHVRRQIKPPRLLPRAAVLNRPQHLRRISGRPQSRDADSPATSGRRLQGAARGADAELREMGRSRVGAHGSDGRLPTWHVGRKLRKRYSTRVAGGLRYSCESGCLQAGRSSWLQTKKCSRTGNPVSQFLPAIGDTFSGGAKMQTNIPKTQAVLLGLGAVLCVVVLP